MPTIQCQRCSNSVELPQPKLEIINGLSASMIVFAHTEDVSCKICGNKFMGVITGMNPQGIGLSFVEIPEPSKIIKPTSKLIV